MNQVVRASLILAATVTLCTILIAATGLHENPMFSGIVMIVVFIGINIGVVYWALARTASTDGYLKQLANSALIGLIGGALIFACSFVLMAFVFPNYIKEAGDAALDLLQEAKMPKEMIEAQTAELAKQTPVRQAFHGAVGTLVTSVVVGAIVAIFKRKKAA